MLLEDLVGCVGLGRGVELDLAHSKDLINIGSANVGALRNGQQFCAGGSKRHFTKISDLGPAARSLP